VKGGKRICRLGGSGGNSRGLDELLKNEKVSFEFLKGYERAGKWVWKIEEEGRRGIKHTWV